MNSASPFLLYSGICDFEDTAICGFTNDKNANLPWSPNNGGTSSFGTGPKNDHTYGTSHGNCFHLDFV